MKKILLEDFEEKFYFKTSHYFWHLLTGLAALALIGGVLILLWGIIPAFKPSVDKPQFPEPVKISAAEIKQRIAPQPVTPDPNDLAQIPIAGAEKNPLEATTMEVPKVDPAEQAYLTAIDSMQKLVPPDKYPWKTRGHWERSWYQNNWVVDFYGIEDRLKSVFKELKLDNFQSKKQLLDNYLALLVNFPESNRYQVLKSAIEICKDDLNTSTVLLELLKQSIPHFSVENTICIQMLVDFAKKNPRDGQAFLSYINLSIPKFSATVRPEILSVMIRYYYQRFAVVEKQQEATDLFLPMLSEFQAENQVKALTEYYDLYLGQNRSREVEIKELNQKYETDVAQAAQVLEQRKAEKRELRSLAWKLIGSSVVFIAFLALFLLVLSIQRNIKQLRERMLVSGAK